MTIRRRNTQSRIREPSTKRCAALGAVPALGNELAAGPAFHHVYGHGASTAGTVARALQYRGRAVRAPPQVLQPYHRRQHRGQYQKRGEDKAGYRPGYRAPALSGGQICSYGSGYYLNQQKSLHINATPRRIPRPVSCRRPC